MAGYLGRFAPSPSGPLHLGSLVAALASYLEARAQGGKWLLRMEDIDTPRTVPGAADIILRQLDAAGFAWDGPLVWQSSAERQARYQDVFSQLREGGHIFPCACTRSEMQDSALARDGSRRYPGTCREGLPAGRQARAWRLRTAPREVVFVDQVQGRCLENVWTDVGDFVLRRADGLFAYQLAVVVDDADAGVTDVLRGADLLDSTPRQIYLQSLLGVPLPRYAHVPVLVNSAGEKLSKQTRAAAFDAQNPVLALWQAAACLGLQPPLTLQQESLAAFWLWAQAHWSLAAVPKQRSVQLIDQG